MSTVHRYLATRIGFGLLVATAVLLPLLSFFDFEAELGNVGQGAYQLRDALLYTAFLLPRRFVELVPFITLLGTVLALGLLAVRFELIILRAAGRSPLQIALAPLGVGVVLLVCTVLLDQFVASPLHQQALASRNAALGDSAELGDDLGIWARNENQILHIGEMLYETRAGDVEIFQLDEQGLLHRRIHAAYADIDGNGLWRLNEVSLRTFDAGRMWPEQRGTMQWRSFLQPREIDTLTKPPESLSPTELYRHVQFLRGTGQEYRAYALALWRKAGNLLITVAMLLLAIPFVFGAVRTGLGSRLVLAALTGIGVYLLDQIVANAGLMLNINPALVALMPGAMLVAAACVLLRRMP